MPVNNVLFVHGYSETSLGAYFDFPERLKARLPALQSVVVSAFNSIDDAVTIDDLAAALDGELYDLETQHGWKMNETAIVCHSTGALVARRCMVNRALRKPVPGNEPSHLITMAGANHGSSLAQIGRSVVGYLQKLLQKHVTTVGARVLTDLDYGSTFLNRLNSQWLDVVNTGPLASTYLFSMGGDSIGNDLEMQLFWGTKEPGSDNTVRISGANLNYTIVEGDPKADPPVLIIKTPPKPVPHLVLPDYSHWGPVSGIWGFKANPDLAIDAVVQALSVDGIVAYENVRTDWEARTKKWSDAHRNDVNATAVFTITERSDAPIEDSAIIFLDKKEATEGAGVVSAQVSASQAAVPGTPFPIHNNVELASYSFYLNFDRYMQSSPHQIHVEAHNPSPLIDYKAVDYDTPAPDDPNVHLIRENEFTYVRIKLYRDAAASYMLYPWGPALDLSNWPPFPPGGLAP